MYWVNSDGTVHRADLDGSNAATIVSGLSLPQDIAFVPGVPEPSTAVLATLGLAAVLLFRTRRRGAATCVVATALLGLCLGFSNSAQAVTINTVPVGNAGNAADTTGYGAVGYDYRIGTTEVTNAQYADFLNAKAASDPLGLYNTSMGSGYGGITRSGSSGSYTYATITGRENMPVNFVSWYDAIRFTNWLNNGQGSGDTEAGAYTLDGGTPTPTNGLSITRDPEAIWFLTSEDEWYKAAYYDPSGSSYYDYPTASDTAPTAEAPAGGSNSANYNFIVADLTNVGAYTAAGSPYGTFDQGGNVWEWNEALMSGSSRGLRGASFIESSLSLQASTQTFNNPTGEYSRLGFRVASVPEPSTAVLAILGLAAVLVFRTRRRGTAKCVALSTILGLCLGLSNSAQAVTISTVPVGNAANAADTTGYGAVAYDYRIGTTEVTVGQYTDFLNAVAATDTYACSTTRRWQQISRSPASRAAVLRAATRTA